MTVVSAAGSSGPEARRAAASTLASEGSQHSSSQLFLCFTLNHHWLKPARSISHFGVSSMTNCTCAGCAGCSLLPLLNPNYLHELQKQPTHLAHSSESHSGQVLEIYCCKDNSFFGSALRWGRKGYRRRASAGQNAMHFPTKSFYLF